MGCVYTAQGFEYDWSGVILGGDLVWRTDRWVPQPGKSFDTHVKRAPLADFDRAVRKRNPARRMGADAVTLSPYDI